MYKVVSVIFFLIFMALLIFALIGKLELGLGSLTVFVFLSLMLFWGNEAFDK